MTKPKLLWLLLIIFLLIIPGIICIILVLPYNSGYRVNTVFGTNGTEVTLRSTKKFIEPKCPDISSSSSDSFTMTSLVDKYRVVTFSLADGIKGTSSYKNICIDGKELVTFNSGDSVLLDFEKGTVEVNGIKKISIPLE